MLGITHEGVVAWQQSSLTDIDLRTLVLNFSNIVRKSEGTAEDKEDLDQIAAKISKEIVEPLKRTMQGKKVVVFAPSHVMQLFPYSALLLDGKPLILDKSRASQSFTSSPDSALLLELPVAGWLASFPVLRRRVQTRALRRQSKTQTQSQ
jgi:hypothetical protein